MVRIGAGVIRRPSAIVFLLTIPLAAAITACPSGSSHSPRFVGPRPTRTATASSTPTATISVTPTATVSATPSASRTATPTATTTATHTRTATATPTSTRTSTPTRTPTATPTAAPLAKDSLVVANSCGPGYVTAYPPGAAGNTAPTSPGAALCGAEFDAIDSKGNLYVLDNQVKPPAIREYAAGSTENAAPIATIGGPHTGLVTDIFAGGIAVDSMGNIFVAQFNAAVTPNVSSVLEFAASSNGDVAPTATITGSNTGLAQPSGVAIDKLGNIYVTNQGGSGSITEYSLGSNGNAAPLFMISGSNTGLGAPRGIAVDTKGTIYVINPFSNPPSITEYTAGSSGNAAPSATISGSSTGLTSNLPQGIALDSNANVFVSAGFGVFEYAAGKSGDISPIATITGADTHLSGVEPVGIAIDQSSGDIAVVNTGSTLDHGVAIPIFAAGANGDAIPARLLSFTSLGLTRTGDVVLDPAGNIYVSIGSGAAGGGVVVYAAGTNGNAVPSAVVQGSNTTISNPVSIAVDSSTIYVANCDSNTVTEFPLTANGNVAPSVTISGNNTQLSCPIGIALDSSGNIYTTNDNTGTVTEYAKGASGNATPIATISGSNTDIDFPEGMAVDNSGKIYVVSGGCAVCNPTVPAALLVFAAGANGNATPIATISGASTGIGQGSFVQYVAVDSGGNMYVNGDNNQVLFFKAGANGNVPPDATLGGVLTQVVSPQGIALSP